MKTLTQQLNEAVDKKKLEKEFFKLNKEYVKIDKQNDTEKSEIVLEQNYARLDAIQERMAEISGILEDE